MKVNFGDNAFEGLEVAKNDSLLTLFDIFLFVRRMGRKRVFVKVRVIPGLIGTLDASSSLLSPSLGAPCSHPCPESASCPCAKVESSTYQQELITLASYLGFHLSVSL